jgi:hypothetical protein
MRLLSLFLDPKNGGTVVPRYTSFFFYMVCEATGTTATPGPIVAASGDSEDDCGEADGM